MKKIIYLALITLLLCSCGKDEIIQDSSEDNYQRALDTLDKYDNYILGEFNDKLLISVNQKGGSWGLFRLRKIDSIYFTQDVQFRIMDDDVEKVIAVNFGYTDSWDKVGESGEHLDLQYFYNFYNRDEFRYRTTLESYSKKHDVTFWHFTWDSFGPTPRQYYTYNYIKYFGDSEFNFYMDSVRKIENHPEITLEIKFSFNCILYDEILVPSQVKISNGKGKISFKYKK